MSEERTEVNPAEAQTSYSRADKGGSLWILWLLIAFLFAYPLSIGPMALVYKNKRAPNVVLAVYWPLVYLSNRSAAAHNVIDWYVRLWVR